MVTSVADTPSAGTSVTRIGTSCERVMVGQRVKQIKGNVDELNVGDSMLIQLRALMQLQYPCLQIRRSCRTQIMITCFI